MELEVIQGISNGRVGSIQTTLFSPRVLLQQVRNWRADSLFQYPNGGRLFVPFNGPLKQVQELKFFSVAMWPGCILARRAADITPRLLAGGLSNPKWGFNESETAQIETAWRALLETFIRNREGIATDAPIPEPAWDVVDFPWTRDTSNNPFGALLDLFVTFFNRLNPLLVAGRAAVLSLVRSDYRGLATKMADNNPAVIRAKWENWGGNWATLRSAVEEGSGRTVQGIGVVPLWAGAIIPQLTGTPPAGGGPASPSNQGGGDTGAFAQLLAVAKPLLDQILAALGINLNDPSDDEADAEDQANTGDNAAVQGDVREAAAGGTGMGTGLAIAAAVGLGLLATGALSSPGRKRKTAR